MSPATAGLCSAAMPLVEQWDSIVARLDDEWVDARIRLALPDEDDARRAASMLGSLGPSRSGNVVSFFAVRRGGAPTPQSVRRGLARLDAEWLDGNLVLAGSTAAEHTGDPAAATPAAVAEQPTLVAAWDLLTATLPPDWSDLYVEVAFPSSDYIARASLRMTPLNARREPNRSVLRFRCARTYGYGGSPQMTRRCLERCDEDGIRGELRLLRVLSDTIPVGTQGPVWHIA